MVDDSKAPFSITTTLRWRGWHNSFPLIASLTLDPFLIMLCVKQGGIEYEFLESFVCVDETIGEQNRLRVNGTWYEWIFCLYDHNPKRLSDDRKGVKLTITKSRWLCAHAILIYIYIYIYIYIHVCVCVCSLGCSINDMGKSLFINIVNNTI